MKQRTRGLLLVRVVIGIVVLVSGLSAQSPDQSVKSIGRSVAEAWVKAWNSHDMNVLADVVDEQIDFLTVGGRWLRGRVAFKEHHANLHATRAKESTVEIVATHTQRLSPAVLLVHVDHLGNGDREPNGAARPGHHRYFVWVLTQSGGRWRVRASTNIEIVVPPEVK